MSETNPGRALPGHAVVQPDRRWAITPAQAFVVVALLAFVGWMLHQGFDPYTAVTTAAVTLGVATTAFLVPRALSALGGLARNVAAAAIGKG